MGSNDRAVVVAVAKKPQQAHLIMDILGLEGIPATLMDEIGSEVMGDMVASAEIKIMVLPKDVEDARRVIKDGGYEWCLTKDEPDVYTPEERKRYRKRFILFLVLAIIGLIVWTFIVNHFKG